MEVVHAPRISFNVKTLLTTCAHINAMASGNVILLPMSSYQIALTVLLILPSSPVKLGVWMCV